jgi:hypothetical protein
MRLSPQVLLIAVALAAAPALAAEEAADRPADVAPAKPPDACSLLTAGDFEKALGVKPAKPGNPASIVIPSGPAKGATMTNCTWNVGETGMVSLSLVATPPDGAKEAGLARFNAAIDGLVGQGWTHQREVIAGTTCGTMTPPKGDNKLPTSVGCMGETRGIALSASAMGKTAVAAEKVEMLYAAAVKRLP